MNNNFKRIISMVIFLSFSVLVSGCASGGQFHRNENGVLKTQTRSEQGVHRPDNP